MMSVMSATENNASRLSYDDQFDETHSLGCLFTPQELPFDDSFGQDFDHLLGILDLHGLQNNGGAGVAGNDTPNTQASTPVSASDRRPPLARRARSNPFYSPSRQIMNLVQKKKIAKRIKREKSDALVAMLSSSSPSLPLESQPQQATPRELEEKAEDAGSSYNAHTRGSS